MKDNGDIPFSVDDDTIVEATNCIGDEVSEQFFKDHLPINLQTDESLPNFLDHEACSKTFQEEDIDSSMTIPCLITPSMNKRRPRTSFYPFDSDMYTYSSSEEEQQEEEERNWKKKSRIE